MSRILLVVLTLIIIIGGLYLGISTILKNQNNTPKPVTLTMWGVKDNEAVMQNVIAGYRKLYPNVTINYSNQTLQNYRTRIQTQISSGQAADIVAVHNTWMPVYLATSSLAPAPAEVFDNSSYKSLFYPVVGDSFVSGSKVYGISTEIDGLALFYNQDILKAQNIGLPKTWDDVVNAAVLTTVADKTGVIKTGGLGIGNTKNVDYWSEIIGLLLLQQPNTLINNPNNAAGKEVIDFFKNPSGTQKKNVWDEGMDNSTKAFAQGKLTFYLGPVSAIKTVKAQNPGLNFAVMTVPQLPDKKAAFACFWGYGVSSKSKNAKEAWKFLKFLTDSETEKYINEQETVSLGMGRPYPRKDLAKLQENDPYLGAFVKQGDFYKSWYLCPETQDNGINDQMIEAFKGGVDSGNLTDLPLKISELLTKFTTPTTK